MNQYLKYALTVAVTAAAMVAYQYEGKPEQAGLAQQAPIQTPDQVTEIKKDIAQVEQSLNATKEPSTKRELTQAELADIDPASIDWEAMKARYTDIMQGFGGDPMLTGHAHLLDDLTQREIAAYNKLHVVPFNPKIGEVCGQPRAIKGLYGEEYVSEGCISEFQFPEHPYSNLDLATLKKLVTEDLDPAAAVFASRYATDKQEGIHFALQAAALSEKSGPILQYSRRRYHSISIDERRPTNDVVQDFANRIVLERISARLGDPRAAPEELGLKSFLESRKISSDEIDSVLVGLDEVVGMALKSMAEMQRDTTGSTQIWEIINA
ncbi:MAG: hypothetical protein ACI883_001378 [Candidatus Azotimanducaceae bacterium]|jgi:hypothetical protein